MTWDVEVYVSMCNIPLYLCGDKFVAYIREYSFFYIMYKLLGILDITIACANSALQNE